MSDDRDGESTELDPPADFPTVWRPTWRLPSTLDERPWR